MMTSLANRSEPSRLLPQAEVCERLGGISPGTLAKMIDAGIMPEPVRIWGDRKGWHSGLLAAAIDRLAGVTLDSAAGADAGWDSVQ